MQITIKNGWLQIHRGKRVLFAINPAIRVMWRNRSKYTAINFPWFKEEAA